MPPWKGVLDSGQLDAIWAYIRANANDRWACLPRL
jgi:hypothetical protein